MSRGGYEPTIEWEKKFRALHRAATAIGVRPCLRFQTFRTARTRGCRTVLIGDVITKHLMGLGELI
jgi:hypothetical protein